MYVTFQCDFFLVSHWPSDHMISLRPLIGHPSFPTLLRPLPPSGTLYAVNVPELPFSPGLTNLDHSYSSPTLPVTKYTRDPTSPCSPSTSQTENKSCPSPQRSIPQPGVWMYICPSSPGPCSSLTPVPPAASDES